MIFRGGLVHDGAVHAGGGPGFGLGVLAYLASRFEDEGVQRLARVALILVGLIIAATSLQQLWLRNILAWFVALALYFWGNAHYPKAIAQKSIGKAIAWGSQRSYCAFLIHFAFILLANTLYIASGLHAHESGSLAIALMLGVVIISVIAANYVYRWIEVPANKLKV